MGRRGSVGAGIIVSVAFESRLNCVKVWPISSLLLPGIGDSLHRLRARTVVLARNAYNTASIVADSVNPPILNPSAWNLKGKVGFIWVRFCFLSLV
jgi:hypothetical protein